MSEIRAGVIGLGFIGATHVRAYQGAQKKGLPVRLAAAADRNEHRLIGNASASGNIGSDQPNKLFEPSDVKTFLDAHELIDSDDVDLISICTHTDTHVDLARRALESGKHVLVEKPVAPSAASIEPLAQAAREARSRGLLCMPAMCMRFWPAWTKLKELTDAGAFGPLRSVTFQRLGSTPNWSDAFYKDPSRSGGALLDLHIHDTDFILHLLGLPAAVFSTGDEDHITTSYLYDHTPHVVAEGCWDRHPGAPFVMRFSACFESATLTFELGSKSEFMLFDTIGEHALDVAPGTGWDGQVEALVHAITHRDSAPPVTINDAILGMRIIEAERRSLSTGQPERIKDE